MKKSLSLFIFVLALSCAFALGQQSTVGQSTDQNTHDHSINPEQAQSQDSNSGKSSSKAMVDDQGLHKQIQEQLSSNPAFSNVQVEVDNGTAKLTGTVASKDDKKKAKEMAKGITGVKKVKDEITVSANSASGSATGNMNQSSMGAAQSDQNTAGSISGNAGSSTATPSNSTSTPSSTPNSSSTPNPPQTAKESDSAASAAGSTAAPDTMASTQTTATPDASAAAAGSVASQSAQSSTTGVQSSGMQSNTTPASASGSSDQVKSDIQTALRNEPTLTSSSVSVDVSDDSIQLSGSANSAKDRDEAKRIAQSFAGNRRVVDNIKVSGGSDMSTPSSTSPGMSPSPTPNSTSPNSSVTPNSTATPNSTNPEQPSVPKN